MDEDEDSYDDGDDDDDAEDNDDNEYRSKDKYDNDYIILPALAPQKFYQLVSIMKMMLVMDMLNIGRWMVGKRVEIFYQVKYVAGLDTEDKQLRCEDT